MGGDDLLAVVIVGCEAIEVAGIAVGLELNQVVLGRGGDAECVEGVLVGSCSTHIAVTVVLLGYHCCRLSQWAGEVVV